MPLRALPAVLLLCAALAAQEAEPTKALEALLPKLDSDEVSVREAAQADLDRLVDANYATIGDLLRVRLEGASAEVRQRLQGELEFLERFGALTSRLALFDALELPDVAGKRLVAFNTGEVGHSGHRKAKAFTYVVGWTLADSEAEVTLLRTDLVAVTYKRDHTLPARLAKLQELEPKDAPLPGESKEIAFEDLCADCLDGKGLPGYVSFVDSVGSSLFPGVQAFVYARWALQRGQPRVALELADAGEVAMRHVRGHGDSFERCIADALAQDLRERANTAARDGAQREELLAQWKRAVGLPENEISQEARLMVAAYQSLLAEDRNFKELPAAEVARLPRSDQVRYWMHRLRDEMRDTEPAPRNELAALGWDAMPELIAHLDDMRPCRWPKDCEGIMGRFVELQSYGECCEDVFWEISGVSIYELTSPPGDGRLELKEAAEAWWKENSTQGAASYFEKLLDSTETYHHALAARALLAIDAAKFLPRVMEVARRADYPGCAELLDAMRDYLGMEHRQVLQGFLSDPRGDVSVAAAWCLWTACASDEGVAEVLGRLNAFQCGVDRASMAMICRGMEFLVAVGGDAGTAALCQLLESSTLVVKWEAIRQARDLPDPRVAETLVTLLADESATGRSNRIHYRVCDGATESLHEMLASLSPPDDAMSDDERDGAIASFRAWWEAHKASIDWAAVRAAKRSR